MIPRDRLVTGLLLACVVMFGVVASIAARQPNSSPALQPAAAEITARAATDDGVIERRFRVEAGQSLFLDTDLGKVSIQGQAGDEVVVRVRREHRSRDRRHRFDVSFQQSRSGIDIQGRYDGPHRHRGRHLKVAYEITVPTDFDVEVKTAGGSIALAALDGAAVLRTSGGSITAADVAGPLQAATSGGSVTAERIGAEALLTTSGGSISARSIDGSLRCETSGGSISAIGIAGDVQAETSGGSIRLDDIQGIANAETSGGGITAHLVRPPERDMRLETSGGSIELRLAASARATLDAHASGGRITTDLPVESQGEVKRSRLRGTLNGGGPMLTLHTSGGGIRIQSH